MKEYSRGSEWRRWDLHIHTASSYDAYKGDDSDKLLADAINKNELAAIKKKKAVRQIIVVTHNANIVVGADAEEVIIANQNGADSPNKDSIHFSYRSGSIENDGPLLKETGVVEDGILAKQGIQQHICDILEGGEKAFEKRKNKYNLNS